MRGGKSFGTGRQIIRWRGIRLFNFLVSANDEAWDGDHWQVELSRCVREYTDEEITAKLGSLDQAAIAQLKRLPCIFAYESFREKDPKFGIIRDVVQRQGEVRIHFELIPIDPFVSAEQLDQLRFELDIGKWELNRTHWAVKDVNLAKELHAHGIRLPDWAGSPKATVDITTHGFTVGLSFPGEVRDYVEQVAANLEGLLGPNTYFYDNNYIAQLARPSLDSLLQDIYRNRSKLIVVFIGADYQAKSWCGVEWRAIREIIQERDNDRIMFVRMDDGDVEGVFQGDGYVDGRNFEPNQIARFISERIAVLS